MRSASPSLSASFSTSSARVRRTLSLGADVLAGRFVAWCVHPVAAWSLGSWMRRVTIVTGYFAVGYALTLAVLQLVASSW